MRVKYHIYNFLDNSASSSNFASDPTDIYIINSNASTKSDFDTNVGLKELRNYKKIPKKALKIKEKEDDLQSIVNEIQEYSKLKQNFTDMGMENNVVLRKNFPIVILNPGFEESLCLTDKISLGNII
jgi:hypothetical protein